MRMFRRSLIATFIVVINFLTIPNLARASDASFGYIANFNASSDGSGILTFTTNGTRTARPACAILDRWVIPANTSAGQFMASTILTALSMRKRIVIRGTGTCAFWGDTETVHYFNIED